MKKFKLLLISIITFLVAALPTSAKKLNYAELQKEIENINPNATSVRIIGNYAFTSAHALTDQDIMLAALTIPNIENAKTYTTDLYNKMAINYLTRDIDEMTGKFESWKIEKNLFGTPEINEGTTFDIRYIDYTFLPEETKITEQNIAYKDFGDLNSGYEAKFNEYGFTANNNTMKFDYDANNNTLNVTGVALSNYTIGEKYGDSSLKYFLGLVFEMEVPNGFNPTIIGKSWNIKDSNGKKLDFEVINGNKKGITLLIALNPNADSKITTLDIDLDGDKGEYEATTLTIDWSALKFENETIVTVGDRAENAKDIADLDSWGYTREETYSIARDNRNNNKFNVTGKVKQQFLHDGVFSTKDGYYFVYTLTVENLTEDVKVTLPDGTGKTKTIGYSSFNADGTLTVLHKINLAAGKTFEVKIDADGTCEDAKCKAYDEVTYTFDFTNLTLEKETSLTIEKIDNDTDAKNNLKNEFDYDLSTVKGYETTFNTDKNNVTVEGLLPIYKNIKANTFAEPTNYYLGITLNLNEEIKDNTEITIPDNAKMVNKVEGQNKVYVLVMINPEDTSKKFDITIDLDGESEEYEAVTYTFDWTKLNFQKESTGVQYQIVDFSAEYYKDDGVISSAANKKLTDTYGYKNNLSNVTYVSAEDHNQGIKGTVREQTLLEAAGYKDKSTGYFVAIKVIVPDAQNNSKKWRLYIDKGDGKFIEQEPITTYYDAILLRLDNVSKTPIKYKVDFDGQGNEYLESEYELIYENVEFVSKASITYNYLDNNGAKTNKTFNENLYIGDNIGTNVPELIEVPYHTFNGWYDESDKLFASTNEELKTKKLDQNLTLTAHWILDADAYIKDAIAKINENTNYTFNKADNNITIEVKEPHTLLKDLNKTIIPEKIAEVLGKGEIKDITLKINDTKTTKFNTNETKENIANAAENLYKELLADKIDTTTISDIANSDNNSYSLVIGDLDKTVTLKNSNNDYKFTFNSKYLIVNNKEELEQALVNSNISEILIASDISDISTPFVVNRKVTIKGDKDETKTLTGNDITTMFNITSGPVTFDHLEVAGVTDAAFKVEENSVASVTITNLTFDTEKYDIPAVKVKDGINVTIDLTNGKYQASKITKEKITDYEDLGDKSSHSDKKEKDSSYEYVNYYNQEKNSQIYKITFTNFKGSGRLPFIRYTKAGERPKLPTENDDYLKTFLEFDYDGEHYKNIGYSTSVSLDVFAEDGDNTCSSKKPEGVLNELPVAYANAEYYPSFCISVKENAVHVNNAQDFIKELKGSKRVIYVDADTIDLTQVTDETVLKDGILTINRAVTIIGKNPVNKARKLNVKAINITASNVVIQNLTINASDATNNEGAVINVKENDFEFLSSAINYTGSLVENALKITDETSIRATIRWSDFKGNVNNYINIDGPLADNSIINLNSFYAKSEAGNYSDIIIKTFADGNPTIRISSNTPSNKNNSGNKYYVKLLKDASGKTATLETESGNNTKLFVEADNEHKTFDGITIKAKNHTSVEVTYLYNNQVNVQEKDTLTSDGGSDIQKVKSE